MDRVKMGVIGFGKRGFGLHGMLVNMPDVDVIALCDVFEDRLEEAKNDNMGWRPDIVPFCTTDYHEFLNVPGLDAILISSSWESHIPIAIEAMRKGVAVCTEIGGSYSIYDCHELVRAYEETGTPFMFLENCCFGEVELAITSMVRNGLFGEVVHCSGAYGHDLRNQIVKGVQNHHYRHRNYLGNNCDNYPMHELGPIAKLLGINRGNRMVSLVSMASKSRGLHDFALKHMDEIEDPDILNKVFNQGDVVTTIIKCANGETIQLRLDTSLPRYYDRAFTAHGTNAFSTGRTIFVDDGLKEKKTIDDEEFLKYRPECWSNMTDEGRAMGHGGMDGIEFRVFIDCLKNGKEMPIDVYDAASWMAISCLTADSIAQGGMPQAIPDFTHGEWLRRPLKDVVEMPKVTGVEPF